ncbi:MAG: carbohydrate-binding domain-containing protein [Defluviitaleaceae bacterium]|nr:carbohydrate-binding domain-containing protein [Defluviitaleaceae bacterium]
MKTNPQTTPKKYFLLFAAITCIIGILSGCNSTLQDDGFTGEYFPDGVYSITTAGRYEFSGDYRGQIFIETGRNDIVELVFDNFSLHNPDGAAINAPNSRRVEIYLTEGTENSVSNAVGSRRTTQTDEDSVIDAVYVNNDLIINGSGTLNVTSASRHGLRSQDYLTINSGTLNIQAAGSGLRGRDGVTVNGGTITINAGSDGIQSNHATNPSRGFVVISDGTLDITAISDGIQAATRATINDGSLRFIVGDDAISAAESIVVTGGNIDIVNASEGLESKNITISGGDISIFSINDGINARDASGEAHVFVRLLGGNVRVQTRRDSIESDGFIYVEGGTLHGSGLFVGERPAGQVMLTSGEFINTGNTVNISAESTQPNMTFHFPYYQTEDTLLEIKSADEETLLSYTAPNTFARAVVSSPSFEVGTTYQLYLNGEKITEWVFSQINEELTL